MLFIRAGARVMGPPSVKYRGIFINDEDWGLQPWAAKTFDPELGDIGPKTYRKVFELMLRLKANTVWPAMHEVTKAFNLYPENKQIADDYAIVMGSSHAEPMLRNNVTEWTAPANDFNYVANRDGVRAYWESRVVENGRFENIYTLGMRGIHDSGMVGARSVADQVKALEQIFTDQSRFHPLLSRGRGTEPCRRFWRVLSPVVSRRADGLPLALHDAARARVAGDDESLRPWRTHAVDRECR
jgi:hypothetical protein